MALRLLTQPETTQSNHQPSPGVNFHPLAGGQFSNGVDTHPGVTVTEIGADLAATTCRACRAQLGLDDDDDSSHVRLEALFVLAITLGMRPGELRKLRWDHLDLANGIIHI